MLLKQKLRDQIAALQEQYNVTEKEFEQAPKEKVERAYQQFERLRGKTGTSYDPASDRDKTPGS